MLDNIFLIDVRSVIRTPGSTELLDIRGQAPLNLGANMLSIRQDTPVHLDGTITNLGEAIMVRAVVNGQATGHCVRCLREFQTPLDIEVTQVFGLNPDFITGEEADESEEEPLLVEEDHVDLTQSVVDEAGLNAPFNPICQDYGLECDDDTPTPDGVLEDKDEEEEPPIDPRWAAVAETLAHKVNKE